MNGNRFLFFACIAAVAACVILNCIQLKSAKVSVEAQERQLAKIEAVNERIAAQQKANDVKVKEAGMNAYKEVMDKSDGDVAAEWDVFLLGVRERNRDRALDR